MEIDYGMEQNKVSVDESIVLDIIFEEKLWQKNSATQKTLLLEWKSMKRRSPKKHGMELSLKHTRFLKRRSPCK